MKNSLFSKKSFFRLLSFNFIPSNYFMENFFSFFKKNKLNINTTFTFFLNYSSSVLSSSCFLTRFFKVDNYFLFFPNFLSLYYFSSYFSLYLRTFYIKLLYCNRAFSPKTSLKKHLAEGDLFNDFGKLVTSQERKT